MYLCSLVIWLRKAFPFGAEAWSWPGIFPRNGRNCCISIITFLIIWPISIYFYWAVAHLSFPKWFSWHSAAWKCVTWAYVAAPVGCFETVSPGSSKDLFCGRSGGWATWSDPVSREITPKSRMVSGSNPGFDSANFFAYINVCRA